MTRVAAYDCGTNSLRLLVVDLDPDTGTARERVRDLRLVRLGEAVDRTGRLGEPALARTFAAVEEFAAVVEEHAPDAVVFAATSAARDAANVDDFFAGVRARTGVQPRVLDGDAEARLTFAGAVRSLGGVVPAPYLVLDIGGGSTELVVGADRVEHGVSLDIGSVRISERHLRSDPPTADEVAAAVADIEATLDTVADSGVDLGAVGSAIGVAGTVTTIAAAALGLSTYERDLIHHAVIDIASVQSAVSGLLAMTVEQRLAQGYLHPGRADVIGGGGLILDRLLRRIDVRSVLVSEQDILDGLAWSALDADPAG